MKILFLNPKLDSAREAMKKLQEQGIALLEPIDNGEAWQMLQLHGTSVDLAIIHLEDGEGQIKPRVNFINQIKADPGQADLPLILTTEKWDDAECAKHQNSPSGANAYLKVPFTPNQLIQLIEAVTGQTLESAQEASPVPEDSDSEPDVEMPVAEDPSNEFQLEDAAAVLAQSELPQESDAQPLLEMPFAEEEKKEEAPAPPPPEPEDPEAIQEMPYLFGGEGGSLLPGGGQDLEDEDEEESPASSAFPAPQAQPDIAAALAALPAGSAAQTGVPSLHGFAQALGDAVVPGGAVQSPDLNTLKKYLLLREQDVGALSAQLKAAREQILTLEEMLRQERSRNVELAHSVDESKRKLADFEKEKQVALESLQTEINEHKFQLKAKTDKARLLEINVREASEEMEKLKERVRADIRKIRVREKELENRLEIMKKDSEALIGARENKIVELKRKVDLLEFNMDLLQDQYMREKENAARLRERLAKTAQVLRVAGGIVEDGKAAAAQGQAGTGGDSTEVDVGPTEKEPSGKAAS